MGFGVHTRLMRHVKVVSGGNDINCISFVFENMLASILIYNETFVAALYLSRFCCSSVGYFGHALVKSKPLEADK